MPDFDPWFEETYLTTKGLRILGADQDCIGDPNFHSTAQIFVYQNGIPPRNYINPGFSTTTVLNLHSEGAATGHNAYRAIGGMPEGHITQGKHTFSTLTVSANHPGAGQRNLMGLNLQARGMGDSSLLNWSNTYYGGPVQGDEGQGFSHVSYLQQGWPSYGTILAVKPKSSLDTTTTQVIAADKDAQSISVVNSAGAAVGDWVVVEQIVEDGAPVIEAVKITAVNEGGPNRISGVFLNNHPYGIKIRPATILSIDGQATFGQQRIIVNHTSTATYSTGTVTGASGGQLTGTGTGWSAGMVGGDSDNIGAICIDVDTFTGFPFNATTAPCRSWHQIVGVSDATHMGVHSFSVAGDASYKGRKEKFPSAYIIRPAMRLLVMDNANNDSICEYSTHTWTVGDQVECALCPYPDVTGFQWAMIQYTPNGANNRAFMGVSNRGARMYDTCFYVAEGMDWEGITTADWIAKGGDLYGWRIGLSLQSCAIGIQISKGRHQPDMDCALHMSCIESGMPTDNFSKIKFGNVGWIRGNTPTMGLMLSGCGDTALGILSFSGAAFHGESQVRMDFTGSLRLNSGWLDITHVTTALPVGAPGMVRLYTVPDAGKTKLMALFPTGAAVQLAIEA